MIYLNKLSFALVSILIVSSFPQFSVAQYSFPEKPNSSNFFVDEASMLSTEDAKKVNKIAGDLLRDEGVPIIVVTVPTLINYGGRADRIEDYASDLFNHWKIGSQERNYGILLLVSRGDRRARIELGAGWAHNYNRQSDQIMNTLMVPEFRTNDYSKGIVAGVGGLDAMARGLALPKPEQPWWVPYAFFGFIIVTIAVIVSLFKSGRKGWGWALLIALGALIGYLLYIASKSGGSSGAFGGGSSGGGGSTGSW